MIYQEYFNIPYEDLGRDMLGCDCYGLVYILMKAELGKRIPILSGYDSANDMSLSRYIEVSSAQVDSWLVVDKPRKGDVAVFRHNGLLQHVAFMLDDTNFIEMTRDKGVQVSQITRSNIRYNLAYFCRYIGVEDGKS